MAERARRAAATRPANRKYLIAAEMGNYCGLGETYPDDRPQASQLQQRQRSRHVRLGLGDGWLLGRHRRRPRAAAHPGRRAGHRAERHRLRPLHRRVGRHVLPGRAEHLGAVLPVPEGAREPHRLQPRRLLLDQPAGRQLPPHPLEHGDERVPRPRREAVGAVHSVGGERGTQTGLGHRHLGRAGLRRRLAHHRLRGDGIARWCDRHREPVAPLQHRGAAAGRRCRGDLHGAGLQRPRRQREVAPERHGGPDPTDLDHGHVLDRVLPERVRGIVGTARSTCRSGRARRS